MRVSSGAVVALVAACGLAACGGGTPARAPTPAVAEFIDVVAALPRSLDPAAEQGPAFDAVETSLAGTLVRPAGHPAGVATLAPAGAMTGFLAGSWRALPGGDYSFVLRHGVVSAYGHTLSAADVGFSFRRELALSAAARSLAAAGRISLADPVTVLGPETVRVNVTAPSPFTLAVLGDFRFGVLDSRAVRAHESAADPRARRWLAGHLAFYGAWELLGFQPAGKLLLRANPLFRRPPAFGLVAIEAVPSAALRLADVAAGEASHTDGLDWADFQVAAHTSGLRAVTLASTAVSTLVPDERFAPFADVLVRRALSLAIDRAAISRTAFAGVARPARGPLAGTLTPGLREPAYPHDVALARRLLARAGHPHGFAVVVAACLAGDPQAPAELASIARELGAIGVRVRVRYVASVADLAALARTGAVGAVLETTSVPVASAAFAIAYDYLPGSPGDIEGYDAPALDALAGALRAGAGSGTPARALAILAASFPVIPLVDVPGQEVTRAGIGGYAAYPDGAVYYDQLSG